MDKKWLAVINPHAGNDRGLRHWDKIERLLMEEGVEAAPVFTGYRMHAAEICKKAVEEGWRRILAVGGDGTLNEVVNGLFSQAVVPPREVTVGLFQVGTGNDWARTMEYPPLPLSLARLVFSATQASNPNPATLTKTRSRFFSFPRVTTPISWRKVRPLARQRAISS